MDSLALYDVNAKTLSKITTVEAMREKTEQEEFWTGEFGDQYVARNSSKELLASNTVFFAKAANRMERAHSCIEFGANIGLNLLALKILFPNQEQVAVEINATAATELRKILPDTSIFQQSVFDYVPLRKFDLVLVKGVLIHINPDFLERFYLKMYESAMRYILICEYFNPVPVSLDYRGHAGKLFKRDFCGEILDQFTDIRLVDYGFVYKRDLKYPQDDLNWFLLEK